MPTIPPQFQRYYERPSPDALSRVEVAELLGVSYAWVWYRTAPDDLTKRARPILAPRHGDATRKGDPVWLTPDEVELLRQDLAQQEERRAAQRRTSERRAAKREAKKRQREAVRDEARRWMELSQEERDRIVRDRVTEW